MYCYSTHTHVYIYTTHIKPNNIIQTPKKDGIKNVKGKPRRKYVYKGTVIIIKSVVRDWCTMASAKKVFIYTRKKVSAKTKLRETIYDARPRTTTVASYATGAM